MANPAPVASSLLRVRVAVSRPTTIATISVQTPGKRGAVKRIATGALAAGAVVLTVTLTAVVALPGGIELGFAEQVAPAGAPVQVTEVA